MDGESRMEGVVWMNWKFGIEGGGMEKEISTKEKKR